MPVTGSNPTPSLTINQKLAVQLTTKKNALQARLVKEQTQITSYNTGAAARLATFTAKSNADIAKINTEISAIDSALAALGA